MSSSADVMDLAPNKQVDAYSCMENKWQEVEDIIESDQGMLSQGQGMQQGQGMEQQVE